MIVAEINPARFATIDKILAGECFLFGKDVMLKVQTQYVDNNIHAVRLSDGAQFRFMDEEAEETLQVLGQLKVGF